MEFQALLMHAFQGKYSAAPEPCIAIVFQVHGGDRLLYFAFITRNPERPMIATTVSVQTKPESREAFIRATIANHEASVREPGNRRFDVLQSKADPDRFLLYEAYDSEETAATHKKTAHYLTWRSTVEPMMAQPRLGMPYTAIRP
jgi:autoinducer 2-degrading protein